MSEDNEQSDTSQAIEDESQTEATNKTIWDEIGEIMLPGLPFSNNLNLSGNVSDASKPKRNPQGALLILCILLSVLILAVAILLCKCQSWARKRKGYSPAPNDDSPTYHRFDEPQEKHEDVIAEVVNRRESPPPPVIIKKPSDYTIAMPPSRELNDFPASTDPPPDQVPESKSQTHIENAPTDGIMERRSLKLSGKMSTDQIIEASLMAVRNPSTGQIVDASLMAVRHPSTGQIVETHPVKSARKMSNDQILDAYVKNAETPQSSRATSASLLESDLLPSELLFKNINSNTSSVAGSITNLVEEDLSQRMFWKPLKLRTEEFGIDMTYFDNPTNSMTNRR